MITVPETSRPSVSFGESPCRRVITSLPGRAGSSDWFLVGPERVTPYRGATRVGAYPLALRHNVPRILPLPDGGYLFCLEDGFAVYDPDQAGRTAALPALFLRLTTDSLRRRPGPRGLRLPYRQNDPRFRYALPALDRPVSYRYRLLGFGERWSEWSAGGEKEFTNLDEGDYRFQVEADWYGARAEIAFTVLPPGTAPPGPTSPTPCWWAACSCCFTKRTAPASGPRREKWRSCGSDNSSGNASRPATSNWKPT